MSFNSFAEMKADHLRWKENQTAWEPYVEQVFNLPETLEDAHALILKYRSALERICDEGYGSAVDIADEAL